MRRTEKFSGTSGETLIQGGQMLGSDSYVVSNYLPSDLAKGGGSNLSAMVVSTAWSEAIVGFYSGVDVLVDHYSLGTSGGLRIVVFQDTSDLMVRRPEYFTAILDAVTT